MPSKKAKRADGRYTAYISLGYDENGKKVIVEKEVPRVVQIPTRVNDLNKAAELLGRRYGLYTEKIETDVDMELNINIDYGEDDTG